MGRSTANGLKRRTASPSPKLAEGGLRCEPKSESRLPPLAAPACGPLLMFAPQPSCTAFGAALGTVPAAPATPADEAVAVPTAAAEIDSLWLATPSPKPDPATAAGSHAPKRLLDQGVALSPSSQHLESPRTKVVKLMRDTGDENTPPRQAAVPEPLAEAKPAPRDDSSAPPSACLPTPVAPGVPRPKARSKFVAPTRAAGAAPLRPVPRPAPPRPRPARPAAGSDGDDVDGDDEAGDDDGKKGDGKEAAEGAASGIAAAGVPRAGHTLAARGTSAAPPRGQKFVALFRKGSTNAEKFGAGGGRTLGGAGGKPAAGRGLGADRLRPKHDPEDERALVLSAPGSAEEVHVVLDPVLAEKVRPHQAEGIRFIWEACMGRRALGCGCFLADDMGLGKTLQTIAVIHTFLHQSPRGGPQVGNALVLCPTSLVLNWAAEVTKWLEKRLQPTVVTSDLKKEDMKRRIAGWKMNKRAALGLLIMSYESASLLIPELKTHSIGLLVCDEAHRLKNPATKVYKELYGLRSKMRVLISGTPIQNNLDEFFALLDFCCPGGLKTRKDFARDFGGPIAKGRDLDATEREMARGREASARLTAMTDRIMVLPSPGPALTRASPTPRPSPSPHYSPLLTAGSNRAPDAPRPRPSCDAPTRSSPSTCRPSSTWSSS